MAVLQYILVIGALWLVGCLSLLGFVFAALVRQERGPKPAPKPRNVSGPPPAATKPSPGYLRRWTPARRIEAQRELNAFQELLNR